MTNNKKSYILGVISGIVLVILSQSMGIIGNGEIQQVSSITRESIVTLDKAMGLVNELNDINNESLANTGVVELLPAVDTGNVVETVEYPKHYFSGCDDTSYEVVMIYENRKNPRSLENPVGTGASFTERVGVWHDFGTGITDAYACITVDHSLPISVSNVYLSLGYFNQSNQYKLIGGHIAQNVVGSQLPYTEIIHLTQPVDTYRKSSDLRKNRNIGKNTFVYTTKTTYFDAFNNGKIQVNAMYNSTEWGKATVKFAILRD